MESVEQTNGLKSRVERVFTSAGDIGRVAVGGLLRSTATARTSIASVIAPELAEEAELAYLDPNTNMPNKRAMQKQFAELLARDDPFAVVMVDLDRFKLVNEQVGHEYADDILAQFGAGLQAVIRQTDSLYFQGSAFRTGGDEFIILAPLSRKDVEMNDEARVEALVTRITRAYLSGRSFEDPSGETITISATAFGQLVVPMNFAAGSEGELFNQVSLGMLAKKQKN